MKTDYLLYTNVVQSLTTTIMVIGLTFLLCSKSGVDFEIEDTKENPVFLPAIPEPEFLEKMRNWTDQPREERTSWFAAYYDFIENFRNPANDEPSLISEMLKFSLIGLVIALILGLLSGFVYSMTRKRLDDQNLQLVIRNGKWIYVERKEDEDRSEDTVVKQEESSEEEATTDKMSNGYIIEYKLT